MTEHVTRTGRTVTIESRQGSCDELLLSSSNSLGWAACAAAGVELYCDTGCGRGERRKCYCEAHGGTPRAEQQLLEDWAVLAPDSVEDYQEAGCASLTSVDVYVVTRPHERGRYVAALGIGGHTVSLRGSHADRDAATAAGVEAWRERVAADVAAIRIARGGTLEWGVPVRPRAEPIVVHAEAGQSAYAARRVQVILERVPDARVKTRVPVCERWVNGAGTHAIAPEDATEWATEIAGPHGVAYVDGHDLVYVLDRPVSGPYAPTLLGAENWSHRSDEQVAARIA